MLHRCSSGRHQGIGAAPTTMASTTFSLFFPMPKGQWPLPAADCDDEHSSITTSPSSPSSSSTGSVDCTLSLGTPSSRRAAAEPVETMTKRAAQQAAHPSASVATAVSWDVAADQSSYCCQGGKPAAGVAKACAGHDPLLIDRRCANCGTTSTPLWRNGPRGPKSLCNACGIRFKKEERRAAATAATESGAAGAGCGYSAQWAQYGPSAAKAAHGAVSYGEGAFQCGEHADASAPFLAWRLNVVAPAPAFAGWPERTSLFQYN